MSRAKKNSGRLGLLAALATAAALLLGPAASAQAAPVWEITSTSNSTVEPGGKLIYLVEARNVGDSATAGPAEIKLTLPAGFAALGGEGVNGYFSCSVLPDPTMVSCVGSPSFARYENEFLKIEAEVGLSASGTRTAQMEVSGGGAAAATTVDPVRVSGEEPSFGLDAFDSQATDRAGDLLRQAGAVPYLFTTKIDFNTHTDPSPLVGYNSPVEPVKDVVVDLPPGLLSAAATAATCTVGQLANSNGGSVPLPLCAPESQVGTVAVRNSGYLINSAQFNPLPLFNMPPAEGSTARLGFSVLGTLVTLDAAPRNGGDYGIATVAGNISQGLASTGSTITLWGDPADPGHKPERACPGELNPVQNPEATCDSSAPQRAFVRNPTSCTPAGVGLETDVSLDSWYHPGAFVGPLSFASHEAPGYPYPEEEGGSRVWGPEAGTEGCAAIPFEPTLEASTTTNRADSPTGLDVDLRVPQDCWGPKASAEEAEAQICQSDLKDAEVTLPAGMSVNPSSAGGLGACTAAQAGYLSGTAAPYEFSDQPVGCPDSSKIGKVTIETPLLSRHDSEGATVEGGDGTPVPLPLEGSVYLAAQGDNPAGSLLGLYMVAEGQGVRVKQFGEIRIGADGRLTTVFHDAPQTPFSDLQVELFGGQRAALRTPGCGSHALTGTLTPWSGNAPAQVSSSFTISEGCGGGFDPKLSAGSQNPLAGDTSPFSLRITRNDAEQELAGLTATLPPGLSGYLKGIPYCPDSALAAVSGNEGTGRGQEASPSCPAASQLGTVTVGAGSGLEPFYTSAGRAYLAGPYKGAPLSLAVVTPAVAGPFDLGSVVVRNALRIDPTTAQITAVSDPIPHILHGIPLDLRDIRVQLDRDHFTLNPTSCEEMQIGSTISSTAGALAHPGQRFQVAGCDKLGFKPKLGIKLKGGTKRGDNPALTAVFRPRPDNANAASIQVALPHSEFLDQGHIRTICTRVQFAANACPAGSIYGKVTATTPILDQPLTGNAYLRSSSHNLPDLVLALRGPASQPIEIDAVGRIDSKNGGIRTTFAQVPDAPLTKVVLRMAGGQKSLLENSTNICAHTYRATVQMDAHNGRAADSRPALRAQCGHKAHRRHKH
jgi:hypothetical protein